MLMSKLGTNQTERTLPRLTRQMTACGPGLAELQTAVAKNSAITIELICAELDEANAVAKERGQAAAMVSASALRAKLARING